MLIFAVALMLLGITLIGIADLILRCISMKLIWSVCTFAAGLVVLISGFSFAVYSFDNMQLVGPVFNFMAGFAIFMFGCLFVVHRMES